MRLLIFLFAGALTNEQLTLYPPPKIRYVYVVKFEVAAKKGDTLRISWRNDATEETDVPLHLRIDFKKNEEEETLDCAVRKFETNCFLFVMGGVDAMTAGLNCQAMGANLVSIHSQAVNDFVSTLSGGMLIWIGMVNPAPPGNNFIWTDGSAFGPFINFRPGEPTLIATDMCGTMNVVANTGTWDDFPCTGFQNSYVCDQPVAT